MSSRRAMTLALLLPLLLAPALVAEQTIGEAYSGSFPDFPEIEYEQSVITIPIYLPGQSQPAEILQLDAYMRLDREAATRNGLGHRQFEFTIADWELIGYSEVLEDFITFTLSDVVQPKSLGVSLQEDSDFPAIIVYSAVYDIWLGSRRIAANRPGVAFAKNVFEIPPRDVTVAFEKPFESPSFSFLRGTCEAMHRILDWLLSWAKTVGGGIRNGTITELPLPAPPEGAEAAGYVPPPKNVKTSTITPRAGAEGLTDSLRNALEDEAKKSAAEKSAAEDAKGSTPEPSKPSDARNKQPRQPG